MSLWCSEVPQPYRLTLPTPVAGRAVEDPVAADSTIGATALVIQAPVGQAVPVAGGHATLSSRFGHLLATTAGRVFLVWLGGDEYCSNVNIRAIVSQRGDGGEETNVCSRGGRRGSLLSG